MDIVAEITTPLRARIIDATLNARRFEAELARRLKIDIAEHGGVVESLSSPTDPSSFHDALGASGEFNCLILIAHGQVEGIGCMSRLRRWWHGRPLLKSDLRAYCRPGYTWRRQT
ncbi:MAG: hypothetical protein U0414_21955 [Polyangiaceae bacterium]